MRSLPALPHSSFSCFSKKCYKNTQKNVTPPPFYNTYMTNDQILNFRTKIRFSSMRSSNLLEEWQKRLLQRINSKAEEIFKKLFSILFFFSIIKLYHIFFILIYTIYSKAIKKTTV